MRYVQFLKILNGCLAAMLTLIEIYISICFKIFLMIKYLFKKTNLLQTLFKVGIVEVN